MTEEESITFRQWQASLSKTVAASNGKHLDVTVGDRIRQLREGRRLSQVQLAAELSTYGNTLTRGAVGNWERDQGIKQENITLVARHFGVTVDWLLTGRQSTPETAPADRHTRGLPIVGEVQAGNWLDPNEMDEPRVGQFFVPPDPRFPEQYQRVWIVRGRSIERTAEDGRALVCVLLGNGSPIEYKDGDLVIAERRRADGLTERTAKRVRIYRDRTELVPEYADEAMNKPLRLGHKRGEPTEVAVVAVVIGVYQPLRQP